MVNYWWGGDDEPHHVFLAALLALRDLPPGARAYWRAMFDTHVFGDPEISAGHIPESLRGALGAMRPGERAELRRRLRSEEHPSERQSLMRISYAVFCLEKTKTNIYERI